MKKIFDYMKELLDSKSYSSSKRFIAIWMTFTLTVVVVYSIIKDVSFTNLIVPSLIAMILSLVAVSTYESTKKKE
jgi:uncharacterized membrane protein YhaH (DUF805 family)